MRLTAKSSWKTGATVRGKYLGQEFTGRLTDDCRPTPGGSNVIFIVELDTPITVLGTERRKVEIWTNDDVNYVETQ